MKTNLSIDAWKYQKIYSKQGYLTKKDITPSRYGENKELDKKWDKYGKSYFSASQKHGTYDFIYMLTCQQNIKSIVDIGCGHNHLINFLANNCMKELKLSRNLVGVDVACPEADIIAAAHNLPFPDNKFDLLLSFDCMEHIPEEEVDMSLKEFERVSSMILLEITLAHSPTRIDNEPVHVCVKSKEWWVKKLEKYFNNVHVIRHLDEGTPWDKILVFGECKL